MSDFELLAIIANDIANWIDGALGEEAVNVATMGVPAPVIEIEYDGYLVSLALSIEHYEEETEEEGEATA